MALLSLCPQPWCCCHVKKYIRIRHLGCLLVHNIESNTKAKERDQDLKIQQTATPKISSLCPQGDTVLTLPSASRVRAMVGSGYSDAQILLGSTLFLNFSTTFCFSISSSISLLLSPVLKSSLLPWSQSFCQVLQTFRYGYLCLFLLCSFSHLNCPLRYSHSAFLESGIKQDPRFWIACAFIDLSGEFSLRLAFIFHEVLDPLEYLLLPLSPCVSHYVDSRFMARGGPAELVTAMIGNQAFALLSFQESQVTGKNMSELVEVEQVLLWDGLGSRMWSGSALPCTFLPLGLHPTTPLCTHPHAHSHLQRLRSASINVGKKSLIEMISYWISLLLFVTRYFSFCFEIIFFLAEFFIESCSVIFSAHILHFKCQYYTKLIPNLCSSEVNWV